MTGYLGIDMGGTTTRWALVDASGAELARGHARGANGHLFAEASRRQFESAVSEIGAAVSGYTVAGVEAGVTGIGRESAILAVRIIAGATRADATRICIRDDIEEAHRLIFPAGGGHLIAAGSGSIGVHVDRNGDVVRVGGRGMLIDDAGSGVWIALRAIDMVFREIDLYGRPEESAILGRHLFKAIGSETWDGVRAFVYGSERGRIGELAQAVGEAAEAGCPQAMGLLGQAGAELARLARALIARCGPAPVAIVGRVPAISPIIAMRIGDEMPGVDIDYPSIDLALEAARQAARNGLVPAAPQGTQDHG
ncbi:MAG TPA: BadF/BadG/BcrA/BcrD ATPase family protein [Devosiaceae bacterium]